jgi:uncharacterized membrane protein
MVRVRREIEVAVPPRTAYDQWTQMDQFPRFMEGVERVAVRPDGTLEWTAIIHGERRWWRAKLVELVPDRLVSWRSVGGVLDGAAEFTHGRWAGHCRVVVQIDRPEGADPATMGRQLERDLVRFRSFIEGRHGPTGAWRRELHDDGMGADASDPRD